MNTQARIHEAISFDEIGIATATHDGMVLRSAYQFIFACEENALRAVAAESFLRPFRDGMPLAPGPLLGVPDPAERAFVEQLGIALHLLNYRHIEVEGLDLVIDLGTPAAGKAAIEDILADQSVGLPDEGLPEMARLVQGLRQPICAEAEPLLRELAERRARLIVSASMGEPPPLNVLRAFSPEILRIDGFWFRRMAVNEAALRLLARLVKAVKARGTAVLIEGIETRAQLAGAIDVGADYVQGFLLSRPQLAGSFVEDEALILLADLLPVKAQIIPLFGGR